jgi:hypothetical protein
MLPFLMVSVGRRPFGLCQHRQLLEGTGEGQQGIPRDRVGGKIRIVPALLRALPQLHRILLEGRCRTHARPIFDGERGFPV